MKTLRTTASVLALTLAAFVSASGQQAVAPPPKPTDNRPSLEATMQFIQDKMNEQGPVGYVITTTAPSGVLPPDSRSSGLSNVLADPLTCTLHAATTDISGTAERTNRGMMTTTASLKDVETISVQSEQDSLNRYALDHFPNRPMTSEVSPSVFWLFLNASQPRFPVHEIYTQGSQPQIVSDRQVRLIGYLFRDEETANRVAKAMIHAVELCGGGNKDPF